MYPFTDVVKAETKTSSLKPIDPIDAFKHMTIVEIITIMNLLACVIVNAPLKAKVCRNLQGQGHKKLASRI